MQTYKTKLIVPVCLLAMAVAARAQTAPEPSASAPATPAPAAETTTAQSSPNSSSDEVVTLQAFDVTAEAAHGYQATETSTGTRIAAKIQDLPFNVDVVTSDFMSDFMTFDLNSQLAFVSGFSPNENPGQYQLRGFANTTSLVDGFRRVGLADTIDIDRIEVIKGAAASIYGATQPGGIVNIITPQPTTTPMVHLEADVGGDSFVRDAIALSGPVGTSDKFFYRLDAAYQFNAYQEQFATRETSDIDAKLLYKPSDNTNITFSLEHYELYAHPYEQVLTITEKGLMPWAGDQITESQYYGMTTTPQTGGLLNYNYAGPESYQHNRVTSGIASIQQKVNDVWSIRLGVNVFTNPYNDQLVGSGAYYPYGTGNITTNSTGQITNAFAPEVKDQPQADWEPQRGGGAQLDDLFQFSTGPVSNKLLLTGDYYENAQRIVTLVPLVAGSQATDYYALDSPYNPSGAPYYTPGSAWEPAMGYGWNTTLYGQNPSLYNGVSTDQWIASADYGLFGSENAQLFGDRLTFLIGGRLDYVRNQVKNYNLPANGQGASLSAEPGPGQYQAFDYNTQAGTYQMGVSYKVVDGLNVYANRSSAFSPQPQIDTYTGLALPNNKSNGYEFGLKTSLLDGRLDLTLDRFEIDEYNIVQSETDPVSGLKDTILINEEQAKGYELDFTYQITSNWIFGGDWGYSPTDIVQSDTLTFLTGLPARRVPRNNVGGYTKYTFSHGPLKGVYALFDGKYYSKSLVNLGSGKSLVAGPIATKTNSTISMYYVPSQNLTYTSGTDPGLAGEVKVSATPVNNVPFPGNGLLPYPGQPANALIDYPVGLNGNALPLQNASVPNVYVGEPTGVFVDDGRNYNFNAPFAEFDTGLGYSWMYGRINNTFRVMVTNIFDRKYTWASGIAGQPFGVLATYNLGF